MDRVPLPPKKRRRIADAETGTNAACGVVLVARVASETAPEITPVDSKPAPAALKSALAKSKSALKCAPSGSESTLKPEPASTTEESRRRLLEDMRARDKEIQDMQELAALERRRTRLLYELRYHGDNSGTGCGGGGSGSSLGGSPNGSLKQERKRHERLQRAKAESVAAQCALQGAVEQLNKQVLRISSTLINQAAALNSPPRPKLLPPPPPPTPQSPLAGVNIAVRGYDQLLEDISRS